MARFCSSVSTVDAMFDQNADGVALNFGLGKNVDAVALAVRTSFHCVKIKVASVVGSATPSGAHRRR